MGPTKDVSKALHAHDIRTCGKWDLLILVNSRKHAEGRGFWGEQMLLNDKERYLTHEVHRMSVVVKRMHAINIVENCRCKP